MVTDRTCFSRSTLALLPLLSFETSRTFRRAGSHAMVAMCRLVVAFATYVFFVCSGISDDKVIAAEMTTQDSLVIAGHMCYGDAGPVRLDTRYVQGDTLCVFGQARGLKVGSSGSGHWGLRFEFLDEDSQVVLNFPKVEESAPFRFDNETVHFSRTFEIPVDLAPGKYQVRIAVNDLVAGSNSAAVLLPFEVMPGTTFAIVDARLCYDVLSELLHARGNFTVGETVYIRFAVAGAVDESERNGTATLRILDENGKQVAQALSLPVPFRAPDDKYLFLAVVFELTLSQEGAFVLSLEVEECDKKSTTKQEIPIRVFPAVQFGQ